MGPVKASKKSTSVPNKALYSRISYLHQAATYLATQEQPPNAGTLRLSTQDKSKLEARVKGNRSTSNKLISDMRIVSQKAVIRMSPALKQSTCKSCDTLLIDGITCLSQVENKSRGGKKPWADILVRKCNTCGFTRRIPVASERQKRRSSRKVELKAKEIPEDLTG